MAGQMLRLTFSVPGADKVDVALSRFGEGITDFRPFWREYALPLLADRTIRNFDTEGGFAGDGNGRSWSPLSPAYAAWKLKHYGEKPILQREGRLYQSLTWTGGQPGSGGVSEVSETSAAYGTTVPYGIFHQVGTRRMPQRQVIAMPESETWGRLLHRFVIDQRKVARLGNDAA